MLLLNYMWLLPLGSCVELPVQRLFLGIAADIGLTIFGGDATDAYAHSSALNETYLAIDDAYSD